MLSTTLSVSKSSTKTLDPYPSARSRPSTQRPAVDLSVTLLPPVPLDFADRHPQDSDLFKAAFDVPRE